MSLISKFGEKFTDIFKRNMPDAFVFALILTLITALVSFFWTGTTPLKIVQSWYEGFWTLLEFGMQMVLLIITGYSIALSPIMEKGIDSLSNHIKTPRQVYFITILMGFLLAMVSWGWLIITAVFARQLALRIKGINYPYLIACVYFSMIGWVTGLSSSIPLLLNTENNFLISEGFLEDTIPTAYTLGSSLNMGMIALLLLFGPVLMLFLAPKEGGDRELKDLFLSGNTNTEVSIKKEAESYKLPVKALSDSLNNSIVIQYIIALMGLGYIIFHFSGKGLDLNLNIMIFVFIILGLLLHKTPMRYTIAMKRASGNISAILFQFPFYAGIMGIMTYTGLGAEIGRWIASVSTADTYPFFAYMLGGVVNFAIPSAGGEYAVIGPSVIEAINTLSTGLPETERTEMIAKASMAIAYGESLTNLLQPFFLLLVIPVMAKGINIQARDIMGYLVLPFLIFLVLQLLLVVFMPL